MSVGEKIRMLRKKRGMTQAGLADGIVTRGMLSQIENETALPSLPTLCEIAKRLETTPGILLDERIDIFSAERARTVNLLTKEFKNGNIAVCMRLFEQSGIEITNDIALIYARCAFGIAFSAFYRGDFITAKQYLLRAESCLDQLIPTDTLVTAPHIGLLRNIMEQIEKTGELLASMTEPPDFSFSPGLFLYALKMLENGRAESVRLLLEMNCLETPYASFLRAKLLISEYKFVDAILILRTLTNSREPPVFLSLLSVSVIETCCRQCEDYKGAYESQLQYRALLEKLRR